MGSFFANINLSDRRSNNMAYRVRTNTMSPYKPSPNSSLYGVESANGSYGTPDTKITAFSPEDVRGLKGSGTKYTNTLSIAEEHDPFVSSSSTYNGKGKAKVSGLSATAPEFDPYKNKDDVNGGMVSEALRGGAPIPGTAEHLTAIIAAENSPSKRPEATHFGVFTTSMDKSRNFKITGINFDAQEFYDKVVASMAVSNLAIWLLIFISPSMLILLKFNH